MYYSGFIFLSNFPPLAHVFFFIAHLTNSKAVGQSRDLVTLYVEHFVSQYVLTDRF